MLAILRAASRHTFKPGPMVISRLSSTFTDSQEALRTARSEDSVVDMARNNRLNDFSPSLPESDSFLTEEAHPPEPEELKVASTPNH